VEVKIGIQSVARELVVDTDATPEQVERDLSAAFGTEHGVLGLTSRSGNRVLVPADKIAFIEFAGTESRRVGFGNIV
jgi:Protein of unknown function (DUF3107)